MGTESRRSDIATPATIPITNDLVDEDCSPTRGLAEPKMSASEESLAMIPDRTADFGDEPALSVRLERRDLLRVLESADRVCADVIRQFYERGDQEMVDVLTELEQDDWLRYKAITELRRSL